jgi:endo-1,3-1,4-beta-glycanase ExoK
MHSLTHFAFFRSPRRTLAHAACALLGWMGATLLTSEVHAKTYKGAEIASKSLYRYGRIEVRMRMARGPGILSTFFTYKPGSEAAGAAWEEIDVEAFGKSNATAWQSNILVGNPRAGSEMVHDTGASLADAYHTYTIEWTPTAVVWQVDGVEKRRTTGGQASQLTSMHNFHFNLWASDVASWAGAFDSSMLPASQYVSWIRYYKYDNGAFVLDWSDDFATFDTARWEKANWTFDGNLVDFEPNNVVVKDGTLVLCLTAQGQTGCSGAVPVDNNGSLGGGAGSGAGGAATGGTGGTTTGGAGGAATAGAGGSPSTGGGGGAPASGGGVAGATSAGTGGASSAGGSANTAGAAPIGGQPPIGGSSTTAGTGTTTVGGGAIGGSPAMPIANGAAPDSGCGCVVTGGRPGERTLPWVVALASLAGLFVRRRAR